MRNETNSDFGLNFPWWDCWFGTYCARPAAGLASIAIGIEQFRERRDMRVDRLLMQPPSNSSSIDPLNRDPESCATCV